MQQDNKQTHVELGHDVVLRVEGLYKKFCRSLTHSMYYGFLDACRSMLGMPYDTGALRKNEFWALEDITFELQAGEALGIIGANGSGKSTLLRLITGIFPPDKGRISFRGRIGALIAVGAGFHPHMTGRENIYLNGTILGMTRRELDRKLDDIIAFADIGAFLEAPVNTYSSGMRVRLGFAIAVHCEPDILLVDEVLSVGDLSFRNKSMRKMAELREKSSALIFISHNLEQVRGLCDKTILLDRGKVCFYGNSQDAIVFYENKCRLSNSSILSNKSPYIRKAGDNSTIEIIEFGLKDSKGIKVDYITTNEALNIYCILKVNKNIDDLMVYFGLNREEDLDSKVIFALSHDNDKIKIKNLNPGKYILKIYIKNHRLSPSIFIPYFAFRNSYTFEDYLKIYLESRVVINASSNDKVSRGLLSINEEWEFTKIE